MTFINKASQVPNPQIQAQKVAASKEPGKLAGQSAGKQVEVKRVESNLIQRLNNSSAESRENILEEVKARYQSGSLTSREAAESTANSILDS